MKSLTTIILLEVDCVTPYCRYILVNSSCHWLRSLLYKWRVHDALLFLKIILEFGHYLPIFLWNPVFKMIFTLLNGCKLKPTLRGLFNTITCVNFFISIRILQSFQESSAISSLSLSKRVRENQLSQKKQLTLCKENRNVAVVHVRRPDDRAKFYQIYVSVLFYRGLLWFFLSSSSSSSSSSFFLKQYYNSNYKFTKIKFAVL